MRASDSTGIVVITQIQPDRGAVHLPQQRSPQVNAAFAERPAAGRGDRRRQQDGRRTGQAAACRQPGRSDHRHGAAEGRVSQRRTCSSGRASSSTSACWSTRCARSWWCRPRRCSAGRTARSSSSCKPDETVTVRPVQVDPAGRRAGGDRHAACRRASGRHHRLLAARRGQARARADGRGAEPPAAASGRAPRRRRPEASRRGRRAPPRRRKRGERRRARRPATPRRGTASPAPSPRHERLRALHPPADRDLAARRSRSCSAAFSAIWWLPVSALPQVDFPTIQVTTQLPGANPDTMAVAGDGAAGAPARADSRRSRP